MDFKRRGPSPATLQWAGRALGPGYRVVAWRRMTGGTMSAVHRLTAKRDGRRAFAVLRQYERAAPPFTDLTGREADILRGLRTDLWWDLHALASYTDDWPRFIPVQAGGRVRVDAGGMTGRVEELLAAVLRRI